MAQGVASRSLGGAWTWPLILFVSAFGASLSAMTGAFSARNIAVLYPLDDSYIHLALARTLAQSGVWGIDPQHPAAASSSPLWTLLLAVLFKLAPWASREVMSWIPLFLNVGAAWALVATWVKLLGGAGRATLPVVVMIAVVPLWSISMIGMEHVLHALLATQLAWAAAVLIGGESAATRNDLARLALFAALAVAARYESLALVAAIAFQALMSRRWMMAASVLVPSIAVVLGFGLIWVHAGGWLLPNSLLLKAPGASGAMAFRVAQILVNAWHNATMPVGWLMLGFTAALLAFRALLGGRLTAPGAFAVLAAMTTAGQFLFGNFDWLYRYEAWLVALDALALILVARELLARRPRACLVVLLTMTAACAPRAYASARETILAAHDREWQHFGPAYALRGLGRQPVLLNDLGVMAYYGAIRPVDLFGLGDNAALRMRRSGAYNPSGVSGLARAEGAHLAEIEMCWPPLRDNMPANWRLVEAWIGPRNVVFSDRTVGFMADGEVSAAALDRVLSRASARADVIRVRDGDPRIADFNAPATRSRAIAALCPPPAR